MATRYGRYHERDRPRYENEQDLRVRIVNALRKEGFAVFHISGHRSVHNVTKVPDVVVGVTERVAVMLLVKTSTAKLSEDEVKLEEDGVSWVVRSVDDAISVCQEVRQQTKKKP